MAESLELDLLKSQLWLERLRPETLAQMDAKFKIAQKEILALIAETQNKRIIEAEINKILKESFSTFETILENDVRDITEISYNATGAIMAGYVTNELAKGFNKWESIDTKVQNKLIDKNRLLFGNTWEVHKQKALLTANMGLNEAISRGFKANIGIAEMSRDIKNQFGMLNKNSINSIVRTSIFQAINESKRESFSYFEDEITEYYYDSVMDSRTTPRCFRLNRKSSEHREDIVKLLDFHWNCRAGLGVRTDISEEIDKLAPDRNLVEWEHRTVNRRDGTKYTKFSVDNVKRIPKDATVKQAFDALGVEYQKDFMGKGRYELYSSGKASFDDMIDLSRSDFIPLKDLKKKLDL